MIPLNTLKASKKLYLLVVVMSVFILGVGWYGIRKLKTINQHTQTLYTDRLIPMEQLTTVRFALAVDILSIAQKVRAHEISFEDARDRADLEQKNIVASWRAYKLTYLTPEEKEKGRQTDLLMERTDRAIENFKILLQKKSFSFFQFYSSLYPIYAPDVKQ